MAALATRKNETITVIVRRVSGDRRKRRKPGIDVLLGLVVARISMELDLVCLDDCYIP